jgi:hypothetical protein
MRNDLKVRASKWFAYKEGGGIKNESNYKKKNDKLHGEKHRV